MAHACVKCGRLVAFPHPRPVAGAADARVARCASCGTLQSADGRPVEAEAECPRCRRVVRVPPDLPSTVCPRCGERLGLADGF